MPAPDPSDLMAPADALADMLLGGTIGDEDAWREEAIGQLDGIAVIVNRQGDVDSQIATAVGKAKGAAILIELAGWDNKPEFSGQALLDLRYSVSLWTRPILRAGAISESIALGALVKAIHGWTPDASAVKRRFRWRVGAGDKGQAVTAGNQSLNVYEFPANFEHPLFHNNS